MLVQKVCDVDVPAHDEYDAPGTWFWASLTMIFVHVVLTLSAALDV